MKTVIVSAMEWQALLNLEKMVKMAMKNPNSAEFLVIAVQSLDQVRVEEAKKPHLSSLADGLVKKAIGT